MVTEFGVTPAPPFIKRKQLSGLECSLQLIRSSSKDQKFLRLVFSSIKKRLGLVHILKMVQTNAILNLVLLGKTGAGKSASGNTILGQKAFKSVKSPTSVTQDVTVESGTVCGFPVNVYDTPGFCDTNVKEDEMHLKYQKLFQKCESGPCAFLLVINPDRFTEGEMKAMENIEKLLGEKRLKKTWILFTKGDELEEENMTITEFINLSEPLKKIIQKYAHRYHVFNNKTKEYIGQVKTLLSNILHTCFKALAKGAKNLMERVKPQDSKNVKPDTHDSLSSRRIVLLGKSGVGKSAAGNTILGQKEFKSEIGMSSVTSECSDAHATVSGRSVSVVDTPGFFDTHMKPEQLMTEIAKSVYLSSPGPHAFLIVFPVNMRYTDQEKQIADQVEMLFGKGVLKYSIIVFTHGDLLEGNSIEKLIKSNSRLRHLVQQCGGRYQVFNNRDQNNREQVNDLLQKIDTMIEQNGGAHYSNQMFEDAHRFREEEEEQRLREEEERKQQEEPDGKSVYSKIKTKLWNAYNGFKEFFSKYKHHFYIAGFAVVSAVHVVGLAGALGVIFGAAFAFRAGGGADGATNGAAEGTTNRAADGIE